MWCVVLPLAAVACSSSAAGPNTTSSSSSGGGGGFGGGFGGGGFGGGFGGGGRGGGRGRGSDGGAAPVVLAKVTQKDVPIEVGAIGNVEASTTISVRSQLTGTLTEVFFTEGATVKTGDPLFTIDPRPYEAQLQMAEANLTRDEALLAQAEAQLTRDAANAEFQQLEADRQSQLSKKGIVAKDAADQARAGADATAAAVKADRASIESAKAQLTAQKAAVENSKVQLSYTHVKSPITGRTGNLIVKPGNLVTANATEVVSIAQVEPVFVTFAVPSVHLPEIKRHMAAERLPVTATPQDNEAAAVEGHLTFLDNAVDASSDTIKLKATFTNSDRRLWPGQFARVTLRLSIVKDAMVVPSQAVQTGQDGQFVFVVKNDSTVEQRPVTTATVSGDFTVITKGLETAETVVTEGQLRLESGTKVQAADANGVAPAAPAAGGRGRGRGRGQQGS